MFIINFIDSNEFFVLTSYALRAYAYPNAVITKNICQKVS
ncbi:hypothetical protein DSUL_20547 [Desulfovibrionales bacterium]